MNQPELGKKINEIRTRKGITQKDLSDKCSIDIRTIQRIESGEVFPRSSTLRLIAEVLEVGYDEFIEHDQEVQVTSSNNQLFLQIALIAGIVRLINWFFYAPILQHSMAFYAYSWLFSIIDILSTMFLFYGFILTAQQYGNKILKFAAAFFLIGAPVYFFVAMGATALDAGAGEIVKKLMLTILGINCIFFGLGLFNTKTRFLVLYKSTAILQFLIAPFFILPVLTLNILGCWLNIPLYILMIVVLYKEFSLLKNDNP